MKNNTNNAEYSKDNFKGINLAHVMCNVDGELYVTQVVESIKIQNQAMYYRAVNKLSADNIGIWITLDELSKYVISCQEAKRLNDAMRKSQANRLSDMIYIWTDSMRSPIKLFEWKEQIDEELSYGEAIDYLTYIETENGINYMHHKYNYKQKNEARAALHLLRKQQVGSQTVYIKNKMSGMRY